MGVGWSAGMSEVEGEGGDGLGVVFGGIMGDEHVDYLSGLWRTEGYIAEVARFSVAIPGVRGADGFRNGISA